jgi:hypothetical protein
MVMGFNMVTAYLAKMEYHAGSPPLPVVFTGHAFQRNEAS